MLSIISIIIVYFLSLSCCVSNHLYQGPNAIHNDIISGRSWDSMIDKTPHKCGFDAATVEAHARGQFTLYTKNDRAVANSELVSGSFTSTNVIVKCARQFVTSNLTTMFESFCQPVTVDTFSTTEGEQWAWNPPIHSTSCDVPKCGLSNTFVLSPEGYQLATVRSSTPSHVAIYKVAFGSGGRIPPISNYTLICGGTIISDKLVVSAAHCFYDKFSKNPSNSGQNVGNSSDGITGGSPQSTQYEVTIAKWTRDHNIKDNFAQRNYKIEEILWPDRKYDPNQSGHRGGDIVLLRLNESVVFNQFVYPACFDWTTTPDQYLQQQWQPQIPTPSNTTSSTMQIFGQIAGWGVDESGRVSQVLKIGQLPYVSYDQCAAKLKYIAIDQFCAGSNDESGSGVRKGDGGGGLLFRESGGNNLIYLRGVASSRELYQNTSISTFTDVARYTKWIRDVQKRIELTK